MIEPRLHVGRDGTHTWAIRFRDRGRQTSETFTDRRDAARFAKWLDTYGVDEALHLLDAAQGAEATDHTVTTWCQHRIEHLTGVTTGTTARYRSYIAHDLGPLGELPVTAITPDTVAGWVNAMAKTGAAGKTIKNKHGFLSASLAAAVAAGIIPSNPCRGTRLPTTITEPMVFLTFEEYTRLLGCVTPRWQPLVETLFATGLRWGEITALRVGDLNLDGATITVTRAWKQAPGGNTLGPPKSKRSRRTIALAPETVTVLRPLTDGRPADGWLFVNQHGGPVRGATFHDNVWQPAVRLANGQPAQAGKRIARRRDAYGQVIQPLDPPLGKRPRVHDARHSCASWLLAGGVPINYVQAHLGHESITTTVDRYGHVMPGARIAVSQALSAALTQSRPELVSG